MKKNQKSSWILSVLLLASACGSQVGTSNSSDEAALGYRSFRSIPIRYKIASTIPESFHASIKEGFESWNQVLQKTVFVYDGIKEIEEDQLDSAYTFKENVVLMTERSGAIAANGETPKPGEGPLARTILKGDGQSSILDADIILFEFTLNYLTGRPTTHDKYSLKAVIAHEAGHMLFGSDHSDDEESIMTAQIYPNDHPLEKTEPAGCDVQTFYEVYENH